MSSQSDLLSPLSQEIVTLIHSAKQRAAVAVNSEITLLYWQVGQRINQEVLGGERADYGKEVIKELSNALTVQFGRGWSRSHLSYCVQFAQIFNDLDIVHALRGQLSWTHFKLLMSIDKPTNRDFYTTLAIQERWSTRTLDERIGALLFERTAISKKPDSTIAAELTQLCRFEADNLYR